MATQKNGYAQAHDNAADAPETTPWYIEWQPHVTDALLLTFELIRLFVYWTCTTVASIWRLFVPVAECSVRDDVVLITGTGHGIGREVALQYGQLGACIICVDINAETNAETVDRIKANGGQAHAFTCDVTDRKAVFALVARVKEATGGRSVSILVNNAGIMPCRPLLQQTEAEIRRTFDVNVYAHFWLLQATLPDMLAANRGHVVALSSIAGMAGLENLVPYCGTKFAVKGLMEALGEELRQKTSNIKMTTIYPYMVDTGLCQKPYIRFPKMLPLLKPADVARELIQAQRRGVVAQSLPKLMLYTETMARLYPMRCGQMLSDFLQSGVNAVED